MSFCREKGYPQIDPDEVSRDGEAAEGASRFGKEASPQKEGCGAQPAQTHTGGTAGGGQDHRRSQSQVSW